MDRQVLLSAFRGTHFMGVVSAPGAVHGFGYTVCMFFSAVPVAPPPFAFNFLLFILKHSISWLLLW
jgi:hypothetical protein